jgi:hypothetical protein
MFSRFADEHFADAFARAPSRATRVGLHEHDGTLDDLSRGSIEERIATLHREQQQLAAIRRSSTRKPSAPARTTTSAGGSIERREITERSRCGAGANRASYGAVSLDREGR